MANPIFIQRSRLGRVTFELRGDQLECNSYRLGRKEAASIPLRSISPDYTVGARRFLLFIVVPLVLAGIAATATYAVLSQETFPHEFAMYPAFMFALCAAWAFRGVRRVEFFVFFDHQKKPLFSIVREPAQAQACEAFVRDLLDRIERAERGLPIVDVEPVTVRKRSSAASYSTATHDSDEPANEYRWKVALIAGSIATGTPFAAHLAPEVEMWVLLIVVVSAVAGLFFGIQSFAAKERLKYVALLGIILALTPLVLVLGMKGTP